MKNKGFLYRFCVNGLAFLFVLFINNLTFAQPSNDDPCNAIPLTAGLTCNYVSYTNVAATNSASVPAPGCASYTGQDVWFSVFVPAGGVLNIDTNTGGITDGGMAAYSGACNSLTLLSCNDDSSPNGLMPMLNLTGLTPGSTIFIRFWKYGGGTGTFSICATSPEPAPPCGSSPAAGNTCATATPICNLNGYCGNTSASYTANSWSQSCGFLGLDDCGLTGEFCGSIENNSFLSFVASSTSISFDVWVTSSTLGYGIQIFIFTASGGCSGTVTQYGPCYNPGVVEPGPVNITAGGLTVGNTYYIMIDGNAGDVCNYTIGANSGISIPVLVSPDNITVCPGETVALAASGGNGTYNWNATPQLNTTSGANVIATPPTTPGTYTYTVNSATGNPLCPSSTQAIATVIVDNCGCTVNATNSGNSCPGGTADLFASTVPGATYSWTGPGGFVSTDQNPVGVILPTTPGNYDYTVTANDGITTCTSTTTITVYALPNVSAGLDQSVCTGASVTLSGSGAATYTWNGGLTDGVSFVPSVGVNNYTVTGTDANGCQNTDQVTVTVNDNPVVSAGSYSAVCADAADVTLVGSPSGGVFSGVGVTGNVFDPTSGTQTITYNYSDGNGCSGSATTTITVNQLPVVNAGPDAVICADGAVTLNGSGAGTPVWTPSSGLSATNVLNPSASPSTTTTYTLTLTQNGCTSSDNLTVTVFPNPTVSVTGDQSLCAGECSDLTVTGADFYTWAPAAGITDVTAANQTVCPATTTTYNVTGYSVSSNSVMNGDFSGGAVNFNSDYSLNSNTQNESTYFVTTNANLAHPGFTGTDHTTGSGNFMVVNGSGTPNTSVWCQTITVQPNTDYVFSTWVSTLAIGSPAILQFSINGTTIGAPFNAPATLNTWDEFYATWNSGSATTATICIVNQNTATGGNDFGIDDIFFSALCSSTESITVTVNPLPNINAGPDVTICEGQTVALSGSNGVTYTWNNGVVNGQPFTPSVSGSYTVSGTDANGCVNTDNVNVTLLPPPTSDFSADSISGYPGLNVNFTNESSDASSFVWVFGNGQMANVGTMAGQNSTYGNPGTYTVYLIADNGYCTDSSSLVITVLPFPDPWIHIPNVFTPNADGANDEFTIHTSYVAELEIQIYNRWGEFMDEIIGTTDFWDGRFDGKEASDGTYFFKYYVKGINGKELTGHGNVTLIR